MEYVQGSKLSEIWRDLSDQKVISVIRQLTRVTDNVTLFSCWWRPLFQQRFGQG